MGAFPRVRAFIEGVCAQAGLGDEDCLKLTLLVEELFTNTVVHGHGGDSDAPVQLTLEIGPAGATLMYEDTAPPHDPFAAVKPPDASLALGERPVGGLGVSLISAMGRGLEYAYAEGRNRVRLVLAGSG
jgi:anti-sigma regulatory factor (Ser/Thr protein kinase)